MRTTARRSSRSRRSRRRRASFEIHNSPLSEAGVVGFEFGYNIQEPDRLVIWEAQYGDFINGAQVIIDQFVTSGRAKWALQPSLVFLLPHGHEGQGPEHSSARPERFLQGAADINMRVVNCTTAAQYFHILRRQAALLRRDPLPLVVLTPKSLLRHPLVASTPMELVQGRFRSVIDDQEARQRASSVRRLVLCSGKVYVDLVSSERRQTASQVAICRVEQLAPFPRVALREVLDGVSVARRSRVAAGRAREHGRMGLGSRAARGNDRGSLRRCASSGACAAPARRRDRPRGTRSTSASWSTRPSASKARPSSDPPSCRSLFAA